MAIFIVMGQKASNRFLRSKNIQLQWFAFSWRNQHWWSSQILLDGIEGFLMFFMPYKCLMVLQSKKRRENFVFPATFAINLRKKFICQSNLCNSFLFDGGLACKIALALFLSTSMPRLCTKNPKKFPAVTPKAHFNGFIFN